MMHFSLCICDLIPRLTTRTRVVLVIHKAELRKPTNTGHIATEALVNSEVHVRGREGEANTTLSFGADTEPFLLFPHDGEATPLCPADAAGRPVTLVVPDGNWRQASKVRARVAGLKAIRCVTLPPGPPTEYRLRSEAHPHGLATIEAIARALGILDGPGPQAALERIFRTMVERTLWIRGSLPTEDLTDAIPPGTQKHIVHK